MVIDPTRSIAYIGEELPERVIALDLNTGGTTILADGVNPSALALIPQASCSGRFVEVPLKSGTVPAGGTLSVPVNLETSELPAWTYTARLVVRSNDPAEPEKEIPVQLKVVGPNHPPQAAIEALPPLFECDAPGGASVSLSGAASSDPDSTPGTADDIAAYEWLLNPGGPDEQLLATGVSVTVRLPVGQHALALRVTDHAGEFSTSTGSVTVVDTTPPVLSILPEPALLWPPNHRMETVTLGWQVADLCDPEPEVTIVGVTSNEPDDAPGPVDGNTTADIGAMVATTDGIATVVLRAERSGSGSGRDYDVNMAASDFSANRSSATATIAVPHDQGGSSEPLLLRVKPAAGGALEIGWTQVAGAVAYDVISGSLGSWRVHKDILNLGEVQVLARGTPQASYVEPAGAPSPAVGAAVFYLIQSRSAAGPTGYGTESAPWERTPASCAGGCP